MLSVLKYTILFVVFLLLIIVYFLFTPFGKQQVYGTVGSMLSKETGLNVNVTSIKIQKYPYLEADMLVENKYNLTVAGYVKDDYLDLDYKLTSNCLQSNMCTIDDEIIVLGDMKGPLNKVHVTGEGKALDGNVSYDVTKHNDLYKDLKLVMHDVNSSKLFALLGKDIPFKRQADVNIHFDHIGETSKKGNIVYEIKSENISGLFVNLKTKIDILDANYSFVINATAPDLSLNLSDGYYDQEKNYAHAFYTLDIKELSTFKKWTGEKYTGPFFALGEIAYDKHIAIKGLSKSFDGLLDFIYENESLQINLVNVPSKNILQRLSKTPFIDTKITGSAKYTLSTQTLKLKTKLENVKFASSELLNTLSEKSGIELSKEIFDNSSIDIAYKDHMVLGDIHVANAANHLLLDDAKIDLTKKSIDTTLDLKSRKHHIKGKTYFASLDDAKPMQNSGQDLYLRFDGIYNTHYKIQLNGLVNTNWINMDYALSAGRLPSHICTIEDDVNISGHLNGSFDQLHISGNGTAMNGTVSYDGTKIAERLENLKVDMKDIHALKLSTLLGQTKFPHGRADLQASFDYLDKENKKGNLLYTFKKGTLSKLPFTMKARINVNNDIQTFAADMTLANATINITEGSRDTDANLTNAFYVVDVKDLTVFEELLGFKYQGPLHVIGEASFTDHLKAQGLSKTFGGIVDFIYENDKLDIALTDVSFKRFMSLFPHPVLLDADTSGKLNYDFTQKRLTVKTNLENAKFLPSEMVSTIYKKSEVNMLVEEFDNSTLDAVYQNDILRGDLKLASETSSFYLTNTTMNLDKNTIDSYFNFKMQDQEFTGKVYGSLEDPQVNLNMQKLIRHKMDKQMDSMVGKGNRKMMEKMPMGEAAKDAASGVAGGFMGVFF